MSKLILGNVRLSYANVFQKGNFEGLENKKFDCTMLFSKANKELMEKCRQLSIRLLVEKYGTKENIPKPYLNMVTKDRFGNTGDKCFFKDGDEKDDEAFEGMWYIKASNSMKPSTYHPDKREAMQDDGVLYSGCYADVQISLWLQDNKYGKKINANLLGLRHRTDGEPLSGGGGGRAAADEFEDLDDVETIDSDELDEMDI